MKKFTYFILCFCFTFGIQAQEFCGNFNENDFDNSYAEQFGVGTTGPQVSNAIAIYDAVNGIARTDGVMDVQLTLIATAVNGATFTDAAITGLTADGMTTYTFIIQENGNADCQSFPITITAPKDSTPDCDFGDAFPVNPGN